MTPLPGLVELIPRSQANGQQGATFRILNMTDDQLVICKGQLIAQADKQDESDQVGTLGVHSITDVSAKRYPTKLPMDDGSYMTIGTTLKAPSHDSWVSAAIGEAREEDDDDGPACFPTLHVNSHKDGRVLGKDDPTDNTWEEGVDLSDSCLDAEGRELMMSKLRANHLAFSRDGKTPGLTKLVELHIDTGDAAPIALPLRRLAHAYEEPTKETLNGWLHHKVVRPSRSPWAFPIVVVKKKLGGIRVSIDYRELNKVITNRDMHWPITLIDSCLDVMRGSKFFTTIDILQAYHNIPVAQDSIEKTAFVCRWGQFEFLRSPFGIKNLPGLWARLADMIFAGLKWEIMSIFFDDLVVYSQTQEEHIDHVGQVLERIRGAGLTVNPRKCHWARDRVTFLGFIITPEDGPCQGTRHD
jgi:hypothetical protein